MSLVKCRECGADVSDMARTCPRCGIDHPAPKPPNKLKEGFFGVLGAGIALLMGYSIVHGMWEELTRKPAKKKPASMSVQKWVELHPSNAETVKKYSRQISLAVDAAKDAITKTQNKFRLTQAFVLGNGVTCLVYRDLSLDPHDGAISIIIRDDVAHESTYPSLQWDDQCVGESTHIRYEVWQRLLEDGSLTVDALMW